MFVAVPEDVSCASPRHRSADLMTSPVSLRNIASVIARYANFVLGGGSATIAVLHREMLEKRKWLSESDFALSIKFQNA